MRVAFAKECSKRSFCVWEARIGKHGRTRVPGSVMPLTRGLPHDLAQYVVEAATGYEHGFWGCVARGATFKSTGRKRTKPGRAVIAAHRSDVVASEHLANHHLAAWYGGEQTPVSVALARADRQWRDLRTGQRLVYEWPSAAGRIEVA